MKKLLILSLSFAVLLSCKNNKNSESEAVEAEANTEQVPDMHTSEIALDWHGTYSGMLPCADCDGIKTEIILNKDNTYSLQRMYLGKDETIFQESGKLKWTEDGGTVVLTDKENEDTTLFKVGENHLKQLDLEGKPIEGEMAEMYILQKN